LDAKVRKLKILRNHNELYVHARLRITVKLIPVVSYYTSLKENVFEFLWVSVLQSCSPHFAKSKNIFQLNSVTIEKHVKFQKKNVQTKAIS